MTDTSDADPGQLTVSTDLTLTVAGTEAELRSTGERLFLEFPSAASAWRAFRSFPLTERRRLHEALTAGNLALELRARHRTIAVLGAGASSGPVARRFGVDPVEVRLCGAISAAWEGLTTTVGAVRRWLT